jgi:hypothetical protein
MIVWVSTRRTRSLLIFVAKGLNNDDLKRCEPEKPGTPNHPSHDVSGSGSEEAAAMLQHLDYADQANILPLGFNGTAWPLSDPIGMITP